MPVRVWYMAPVISDKNSGNLTRIYNLSPTQSRKNESKYLRTLPPPYVVSFDTRTISTHEKIQLLKAPSMESNKIWKNCAFYFGYNCLCAK